MPNFQTEKIYSDMLAKQDAFLSQLKSDEHLYLYSKQAVEKFFHEVCVQECYITFEPAIFSHYDMFFIVSREPLQTNSPETIENYLHSTSQTRFTQAMIDLANQRDTYIKLYQEKSKDLELVHARLLKFEELLSKQNLSSLGGLKKILRSLFAKKIVQS